MSTHEYPTKDIPASELTEEHVLVGKSGGLSAVYLAYEVWPNRIWVTTEHGFVNLEKTQLVTVYDPPVDHCGHSFRIYQEESVEYRSFSEGGHDYVDYENRGEEQSIYCATCEMDYVVSWDGGRPELVPTDELGESR